MQKELLIVGAGLTGSLTAALLQQQAPNTLNVAIWEKARGSGGRMSTHRSLTHQDLCVDMGAQYLSRRQESGECGSLKNTIYDDLLSNKVIVPFQGIIEGEKKDLIGMQNYVAPKGLNSIVKHYLTADVFYQHHLSEVRFEPSNLGTKIACTCLSKHTGLFDGLILTLPVPQLFQLKGDIVEMMTQEHCSDLSSVKYSSRYALGLFYKEHISISWSAKYFDDPIIRFAAWDTAKRGCDSNGSTLLLHTSVPFGIRHLETDKEEVKAIMTMRADKLIQGLPDAIHSHLVRWRYSQVSQVYPGSPGCLILSHDPLVVATGDGFSGSNFENCIRAAQITAKTVMEHV